MKLVKYLFIAGAVLVIALPLWILILPYALDNAVESFEKHVEYTGQVQWREPLENLSAPFVMNEIKNDKVISHEGSVVTVKSTSHAVNPITNETFWDSESNYTIDSLSNAIILDNTTAHYSFSRHTRQQDYPNEVYFSYLPPLVFKFERTEKIGNLELYVFSYNITVEASAFYPAFANNSVVMDDWGELWVEPSSGYVVQSVDNWLSYLSNPKAGSNAVIDNGKIWYTDDTIKEQSGIANVQKNTILVFEIGVPAFILIAALALFSTGFVAMKMRID